LIAGNEMKKKGRRERTCFLEKGKGRPNGREHGGVLFQKVGRAVSTQKKGNQRPRACKKEKEKGVLSLGGHFAPPDKKKKTPPPEKKAVRKRDTPLVTLNLRRFHHGNRKGRKLDYLFLPRQKKEKKGKAREKKRRAPGDHTAGGEEEGPGRTSPSTEEER